MNEANLKMWLQQNKSFQLKSSRDVVSRCKRVERELDISLDEALLKPQGLENILNDLDRKSSTFLAPDVKKAYALGVLRRAVKLYAEYLQAKI